MIKPTNEVKEARAFFQPKMPRFGKALATHSPTLMVGLHEATKSRHTNEAELRAFGTKVIKLPEAEVGQFLKTAAAIHASHGAKPALSFIRGELNVTHAAPATLAAGSAPQPPLTRTESGVLMKLIRLDRRSKLKPADELSAVRKLFGKNRTNAQLAKKLNKHNRLMGNASALLGEAHHLLTKHKSLGDSIKVSETEVEHTLIPIYPATIVESLHHGSTYTVLKLIDQLIGVKTITNHQTLQQVALALKTSLAQVRATKIPPYSYSRHDVVLEKVLDALPSQYVADPKKVSFADFERILKKETEKHIAQYNQKE